MRATVFFYKLVDETVKKENKVEFIRIGEVGSAPIYMSDL